MPKKKETFKKTSDSLIEIFRKELGNDKLDVKIAKLKDENVASMITLSEQNRRMQEMMKMYGMNDMGMDLGGESTLILNANHPLVQYVVDHAKTARIQSSANSFMTWQCFAQTVKSGRNDSICQEKQ